MSEKTLGIIVGGAVIGAILGIIVLIAKLVSRGLHSPSEGGRRMRLVFNGLVLLVLAIFGVQVLGPVGATILAVVCGIAEWIRRGFNKN